MDIGITYLASHKDAQCPCRLIQLDSSKSLLSLFICVDLGFKMLLCICKNLSIDFSNRRKCRIPSAGAGLQIYLNIILWMATAASERITWETFCYHQHSEVDVVQTSSQLIIENLQVCLFQEEKTPHF